MTAAELIAWRTERNLKRRELAAQLGVSERAIIKWEREERGIPPLLPRALASLDCEMRPVPTPAPTAG